MPDYQMSELVVGGIGKHRFLILDGYQLLTPLNNRIFQSGIGSWNYNGSGVISRVSDSDVPIGNYCLKIEDDNAAAEEYAYWTHTVTSLSGKQFVTYFWAKGSSTMNANVQLYSNGASDTELGNTDIGLTTNWKPYYVTHDVEDANVGTELYLRIKPYANSSGASGTGTMYINNIHLYEVGYDYEFDQAKKFKQRWNNQLDADYKLCNRARKVYEGGSIYEATLNFDYIEPPEEIVRQKLFAARSILFVPHIDYNWAVLCKWKDDYNRDYFHDRYIGHEGDVKLEGLEILGSDPPEMPAGAGAGDNVGSGTITMEDVIVDDNQ